MKCFSPWTTSIHNLPGKIFPLPYHPHRPEKAFNWSESLYSLPTSLANLLLSNHLINTCGLQELGRRLQKIFISKENKKRTRAYILQFVAFAIYVFKTTLLLNHASSNQCIRIFGHSYQSTVTKMLVVLQ